MVLVGIFETITISIDGATMGESFAVKQLLGLYQGDDFSAAAELALQSIELTYGEIGFDIDPKANKWIVDVSNNNLVIQEVTAHTRVNHL
jgi:hypothetical protein